MSLGTNQVSSSWSDHSPWCLSQGASLHPRLHLVAALPGHQCRPLHPPLLPHHSGHYYYHHGQVQRHQACGVPQREAMPLPAILCHRTQKPGHETLLSRDNQNACCPVWLLLPFFSPAPPRSSPMTKGCQLLCASLWHPTTFPPERPPLGVHIPRETAGKTEGPGPVLTDCVTLDKSPLLTPCSSQQKNGKFRLARWLLNVESAAFISRDLPGNPVWESKAVQMAEEWGPLCLVSPHPSCHSHNVPPWNLKVQRKTVGKSLCDNSIIDKTQTPWVQIPMPLLISLVSC